MLEDVGACEGHVDFYDLQIGRIRYGASIHFGANPRTSFTGREKSQIESMSDL